MKVGADFVTCDGLLKRVRIGASVQAGSSRVAASRLFLALIIMLMTPACVRLTMAWTDLSASGPTANPPITAGGEAALSLDTWERASAPQAREALQTHVYGVLPDGARTIVENRRIVDAGAFNGAGVFEEFSLSLTAEFDGVSREARFIMAVATPANAAGPTPVILMETFCPRWATLPHPDALNPADARDMMGGVGGSIATFIFGRYICTPPIEDILNAGYAIATIAPSEFVPDRPEEGLEALRRLSAGHRDDDTRWGAIGAWGWAFSRMVDALEEDPRFDREAMIVWGHSRYGKAALVAAAYDDRIDGVISHQSGTGGASLNRQKKGESVAAITDGYPHWFAKTYARYAGREQEMPVDQHHLLALIAPRPVLLGNARRDVWSDPNGAFRAAIGADPIYQLYGVDGLTQDRLKSFNPQADIAFWIRPGTHGVVKEDWPAFLAFLDAHFKEPAS